MNHALKSDIKPDTKISFIIIKIQNKIDVETLRGYIALVHEIESLSEV